MGDLIKQAWPRLFDVEFTGLSGASVSRRVVTWAGPEKAVFIAARLSGREGALDDGYAVAVRDLGEAPSGDMGTPNASGCLIDRNEW